MSNRSILSRVWPLLAALGVGTLAVLAVVAIGQTMSVSAQGASLIISKTASETDVHPNTVVIYTITFTNTGTVSTMAIMTDIIPYGVHYVGGSLTSTPPGATYTPGPLYDAQVNWSGTVNPGATVIVTFQVLVAEPETLGPLPILNEACVYYGPHVVCDDVLIHSRGQIFLPLIMKDYAPCPIWPFDPFDIE